MHCPLLVVTNQYSKNINKNTKANIERTEFTLSISDANFSKSGAKKSWGGIQRGKVKTIWFSWEVSMTWLTNESAKKWMSLLSQETQFFMLSGIRPRRIRPCSKFTIYDSQFAIYKSILNRAGNPPLFFYKPLSAYPPIAFRLLLRCIRKSMLKDDILEREKNCAIMAAKAFLFQKILNILLKLADTGNERKKIPQIIVCYLLGPLLRRILLP